MIACKILTGTRLDDRGWPKIMSRQFRPAQTSNVRHFIYLEQKYIKN